MSGCGCGGGDLRPVDEAVALLLERAPQAPAVEWVPLSEALGRVLAEGQFAAIDLPAWDNSAMDGYALRAADVPAQGASLPLAGRIAAGEAGSTPLPAGHAVRIFTGAPIPPGADTVVPQERCEAVPGEVRVPPVQLGDHVRRKGEEVRRGEPLVEAGKRLRPQELGLLASVGIARVPVHRRLRVGLLSSGDELREPGEPLGPGQIYNANRYTLCGLLRSLGLDVQDYAVLVDELAASRDALSLAVSECDVLVSSGGVSVGEEDHLKNAIRELGELHLWRLAIQPGKPLAYGEIDGKPWLGLPGNPAAALITALVVMRPFLLRAQGVREVLPAPLALPAGFAWPQPRSRRQYLRARLEAGRVVLHPDQGSAMLRAASWADGLALAVVGGLFGSFGGEPQALADGSRLWLQNAGLIWVPFIAVVAVLAWFGMNDIADAKASVRDQAVIFKRPHNWLMCWLYIGTFGSFIGFSAGFAMLSKTQFPHINPLQYAFLGPLVGALSRTLGGWLADKFGGARITLVSYALMIAFVFAVMAFLPGANGGGDFWGFLASFVMLFFFAGIGNGSTFCMIPVIFRGQWARRLQSRAVSAEQAAKGASIESAAVIGFSAAIGAFGGFFIPKAFGTSLAMTGSAQAALYGFVGFYLSCILITWWCYARRGAANPC